MWISALRREENVDFPESTRPSLQARILGGEARRSTRTLVAAEPMRWAPLMVRSLPPRASPHATTVSAFVPVCFCVQIVGSGCYIGLAHIMRARHAVLMRAHLLSQTFRAFAVLTRAGNF